MWGHWREILPLNQSVLLWCNFQSVSQLVLHCACRNQWFGSFCLEIELGFVGCIIYARCHIQISAEALDWSWSPQVPVYTLSVFHCASFWFLWEGLLGCFGLGTCLAEFRLWLGVKLDTGNVALCDCVLDSWRCNVAKFPVGFADGQLDHRNARIVDSRRIIWCCYTVETIGTWYCCHGVTTWVMDGAHATTEYCRAFCIIQLAYQDESKCHVRGMYCLLEYGLGVLCTIW